MQVCRLFIVCISLCLVTSALAQHVDVRPYVRADKLQVGTAALSGATVVPLSDYHRVFGAEFGEDDPGQPFFTEDPGFLSEPGALTGGAGKPLAFNVLSGLKYWTGSGFGPLPSGESLSISLGSQDVNVSTSPVAGFGFPIGEDEGLHDHLWFQLLGPDGNPDPSDGVEPTAGVYLLQLELATTIPGIAKSDPLWFVFNNHVDELEHDAAVEWVAANYVPEPASGLALFAGGLIALIRRRAVRGA